MQLKLTKIFQKVPEGYIGFVEELPGANTQGETLEETRSNLEEAIELVLEANRMLAEEQGIKGDRGFSSWD
ncbi:MAG: type II toxin-antitoxin system HicB family antitoxin [Microcystis aeruginosa W13-18]|jgi:predicted RNase H-like HicB family nuclease|nr:type II toxin-antitoxin system HicB family antitoxin [Microcystis aeruginosa W13-18]NCR38333.1 type II toxin-antitoxin system HicB family antitoxin [Microcystis aeruginosa S11-05]NCR51841.1 type II toxin-antitoxin system HicB family antitoxin [Microcystis aeruginosa S11-01]NCS78737.1 type II toxin-antitoxin system HicB family antitoxin [Microcystis aeruginosa K13-07]